jgi:hypothetical protein
MFNSLFRRSGNMITPKTAWTSRPEIEARPGATDGRLATRVFKARC